MTSLEVGRQIRQMIDDAKTSNWRSYGGRFQDSAVKPGTAHFSLIDGSGNVLTATSTVNL